MRSQTRVIRVYRVCLFFSFYLLFFFVPHFLSPVYLNDLILDLICLNSLSLSCSHTNAARAFYCCQPFDGQKGRTYYSHIPF